MLALYTIEYGKGNQETRYYIKNYLDVLKYLILGHIAMKYEPRDILFDWNETIYETRKNQYNTDE